MNPSTFVTLALVLPVLFAGCSSKQTPAESNIEPFFNEPEFVGLVELNTDQSDIKLDYQLDGRNDDVLTLTSCKQVSELSESDVVESQFKLYRLLSANCLSASKYNQGQAAKVSHFNDLPITEIIKTLPAESVPDLGGESLENRADKTLWEFENGFTLSNKSELVTTVNFKEDLDVDYVLLARKDLNNDGIEDIIFRLDWHITSAFGSGTSLIAVSKLAADSQIKILWRRW